MNDHNLAMRVLKLEMRHLRKGLVKSHERDREVMAHPLEDYKETQRLAELGVRSVYRQSIRSLGGSIRILEGTHMSQPAVDLASFKKDLRDLLTKHKVILAVDIEGDTHGVTENFVVIDSNDTMHTLVEYSAYLTVSDLREDDT